MCTWIPPIKQHLKHATLKRAYPQPAHRCRLTYTHIYTPRRRVSVTDRGGKGQCTTGTGPIIVLTQRSGVTRLCPAKCQRKAQLGGEREGKRGAGRTTWSRGPRESQLRKRCKGNFNGMHYDKMLYNTNAVCCCCCSDWTGNRFD